MFVWSAYINCQEWINLRLIQCLTSCKRKYNGTPLKSKYLLANTGKIHLPQLHEGALVAVPLGEGRMYVDDTTCIGQVNGISRNVSRYKMTKLKLGFHTYLRGIILFWSAKCFCWILVSCTFCDQNLDISTCKFRPPTLTGMQQISTEPPLEVGLLT